MGEAKRRKANIDELKKTNGPKEKKRRSLRLKHNRDYKVPHFKNAAARAKVKDVLDEHKVRNSGALSALLNSKEVPATLVNPVIIKVYDTVVFEKPPRIAKKAEPLVLVTGRKLKNEEFLTHAMALAQINPNGFRQPSAKEKNFKSTSLMEQISERMGVSEKRIAPERSERGQKKLASRNESNALIVLDRMIQKHGSHKSVNFLVAKVCDAVNFRVDTDWLKDRADERIKAANDYTHLHAAKRRRYRTYEAAADDIYGRAA